ncbi:MAG: DUF493 domain-containing protein [Planctomycetes bacterium]|nr:DUF493 domain-containing protein [Planctomycetota bacterium]
MSALEGQPLIPYPCSWPYRILCGDEAAVRAAIAGIVGEAAHTLTQLGASSSGRISRLELVVTVRDEDQRNTIFAALVCTASVRFVL